MSKIINVCHVFHSKLLIPLTYLESVIFSMEKRSHPRYTDASNPKTALNSISRQKTHNHQKAIVISITQTDGPGRVHARISLDAGKRKPKKTRARRGRKSRPGPEIYTHMKGRTRAIQSGGEGAACMERCFRGVRKTSERRELLTRAPARVPQHVAGSIHIHVFKEQLLAAPAREDPLPRVMPRGPFYF